VKRREDNLLAIIETKVVEVLTHIT